MIESAPFGKKILPEKYEKSQMFRCRNITTSIDAVYRNFPQIDIIAVFNLYTF